MPIRKIIVGCLIFFALVFFLHSPVQAQRRTATPAASPVATVSAEASAAAAASLSAETASPAAAVEQIIQAKTEKDITETTTKKKDRLVEILDTHPINPLSWYNFLQHGVRRAVANGMPANILVLILLFPIITSIISFSRHVIGLKGFGVYTPAVLSVAFVSTGIFNGIFIFLIILFAAMLMKRLLKRLNMQALPRTAMLLWGVSIVTLAVLITASFFPLNPFLTLNIFPILIIMLLTENFMESQLAASQSEAFSLTAETLVVAILCSFLVSSEWLQNLVILQPELTLIAVASFNIIVGKYAGLRLLEWMRFRSVIE